MPMWYFDNGVKECLQFHYFGCGGNFNRFVSKEECQMGCGFMG